MKSNPLLLLLAQGFAAVAVKRTGNTMSSKTDPTPKVIWGSCSNDMCTYDYWTSAGTRHNKKKDDMPLWRSVTNTKKCPGDTKCKSIDCLATKAHEVSCNVAGKNKRNVGGKNKRNAGGKKKRNIGRERKHQLRNRI
ncbi:unnamed protein product [Clonostachys solani]|uniref:Secreted protein n=1 Tax=Clonostachys solani TaxID=160281 RepID=A0A9P0EJV8_9HYPO|nr:unnamed protein product [Clonostachys solani]